ncbi:uncharacterized protein LOC135483783 [Lineus longissimus]|uniref:uncharacterized protein LOC135483783 n=1 Tax=Lineus longissimus TaxID=88925 RepID=UPI00315D4330
MEDILDRLQKARLRPSTSNININQSPSKVMYPLFTDLNDESAATEIGIGGHFLVQDYYLAIMDDDLDKVIMIFTAAENRQQELLLNGDFQFNVDKTDSDTTKKKRKPKNENAIIRHVQKQLKETVKPLTLAAAYGAVQVFIFLLESGADVLRANEHCGDIGGIVDLLIATCHTCPSLEDKLLKIYDYIIQKVTNPDDRRRLLLSTGDGLCPLEGAIKLRCYGLFKAILYTEGVFLQTQSHKGKIVTCEFDLTVYASDKRCSESPLNFIDYIRYSEIDSFVKAGILEIPVIQEWINRKVRKFSPWIGFWLFWRMIYPFSFFLSDWIASSQVKDVACPKNASYAQENDPGHDYLYKTIIKLSEENADTARKIFFAIANVSMAVPTLFFDITEIILHLKSKMNYVNRDEFSIRRPFSTQTPGMQANCSAAAKPVAPVVGSRVREPPN